MSERGLEKMCGICGIYNHQSPVDEDILTAMTRAMNHRGPDDEGFFASHNIGLGFRRLSIVDIENGHQPLSNEDGSVWVVFNGEIYNHLSLRNNLIDKGHTFRSQSDTEVIVHLYEEYGINFVSRLNGMFAIGLVDLKSRSLYLIRDHFGIKPLYYAVGPHGLSFASEIRSILKSGLVPHTLAPQAMWDYLTFQYVPGEQTMLSGIQRLAPAHYLKFQDGHVSIHRYWSPEFLPNTTKPLTYFVEGLRYYLEMSVQRHLQGSVPLGSFLSGGVDSNAIASLIKRHQPLHTFSVGIEDSEPSLAELHHAQQIANHLQTIHHSLVVSRQTFMDRLPEALYALEEPLGDPSAIALYFIAELAREHVTVVLSGEGADEIFGGYPIYHEPKSLAAFRYLPMSLRSTLGQVASTLPRGVKGRNFLMRGSQPLERRFIGNIRVLSEDAKHELFEQGVFQETPLSSFNITDPIYQRHRTMDDITKMQLVDLNTWLPGDILFKADKMTMAHSLELRVPYLDRSLFQFAATIPTHYRLVGSEGKHVLREAVRAFLPEDVIRRPKLGFPIPYREWISQHADDMRELLHRSPLAPWFNKNHIENMLFEHKTGAFDHGRTLWALLSLFVWHQVMIE